MSRTSHLSYRPDIDGLRAIAVSLVVTFHFFPQLLPGGFIGVDVFFVISGFLITSIIQKDLSAGEFSLVDFYIKRVRRIFPSLVVVLLSILIVGWISLTASEYSALGKHIVGGATFLSNVLLSRESGYFDIAADRKPLLHLWSLGVEEQFYLLWPICLFFIWRFRKTPWHYVLIVIIASLAYENSVLHTRPEHAFYFPMARFWELLSGALLTVFPFQKIRINQRFNDCFANFCSIGGGVLIGASAFLIDQKSPFPGVWAIMPVSGAVLLISAGPQAILNRHVFSTRVFVFLGTISYPLYLWHWPLISFAHILKPEGTSVLTRCGLIVLAVSLAWGTYNYIEKRFRFGIGPRIKASILVGALACLGCAGLVVYSHQGFEGRLVDTLNDNPSSTKLYGGMEFAEKQCGVSPEESRSIWWCFQDIREKPKFAVWGDSHADALYWGLLRESIPGQRWRLLAKPSCPPVLGVSISDECDKYNQIAINSLINDKSISLVVITGAKGNISDRKYLLPDREKRIDDHGFLGISMSIQALMRAGKSVIFVIDNPQFPDPKDCMGPRLTSIPFINKVLSHSENSKCEMTYTEHLEITRDYRAMVDSLAKKFPTLQIYNPLHLLCDMDADKCSMKKNHQFLYSYGDHISDYANEMLGREIIAVVNTSSDEFRKKQFPR